MEPGSIVYTNGLKSFTRVHEAGYKHVPRTQPLRTDLRKGAKSVVPLADRAIGNLQQWLIGSYHGLSRDQLQVYLDKFVSDNRRRLPMAAFQTLLGLGTGRKPTPYKEIRGAADLSKSTPNTLGLPETTISKSKTKCACSHLVESHCRCVSCPLAGVAPNVRASLRQIGEALVLIFAGS